MPAEPQPGTRPFAVVVVSYGSSALLERNLTRTQDAVAADEIVVVDNFSSDDERLRMRELAAARRWTLVESAVNSGFGGGANVGIAAALALGAGDVLLLNPDASIDGTAVAELRRASGEDGMAVVSPVVRDPQGRVWFGGADLYLDDGRTRGAAKRDLHPGAERWEWLSGACLWIPQEVWNAVGGFDEEYFLYWEDVDFSRRVIAAGGRLAVAERAAAIHDEGGTHRDAGQTGRAKSSVYYYYNIRNRMLFASKHLDEEGLRRWRRSIPSSAWEILLRGGRRQFAHPAVPLKAAWSGMRDARRIARSALRSARVAAGS